MRAGQVYESVGEEKVPSLMRIRNSPAGEGEASSKITVRYRNRVLTAPLVPLPAGTYLALGSPQKGPGQLCDNSLRFLMLFHKLRFRVRRISHFLVRITFLVEIFRHFT